jgi:hypothetical protein
VLVPRLLRPLLLPSLPLLLLPLTLLTAAVPSRTAERGRGRHVRGERWRPSAAEPAPPLQEGWRSAMPRLPAVVLPSGLVGCA